jgi:lipid II:glycine glycyltransferase (peptidoglycan interpeptide bridge formation enzyme)
LEKTLEQSAALPASHSTNPQMTRVIDLKPPAEEILASISQSTRSLIRKNQRENFLRFKTSTNPGDMEIFVRMLDTVADRNQVRFFSQDYFEKQARLLMPKGLLHLEIAQGADKPLAAALIHDYGGMSTYTYAASLPEARQTSASALLLWQAILDAKQRGAQRMDLFGIAADDAPASHPWQGFSSFKKKFGGEIVNHAGTWDLPISGRYRLYRQARRANHLLRRSR